MTYRRKTWCQRESDRMRQVARCPSINNKRQIDSRGTEGEKREPNKGSGSYRQSAKHTKRESREEKSSRATKQEEEAYEEQEGDRECTQEGARGTGRARERSVQRVGGEKPGGQVDLSRRPGQGVCEHRVCEH